MRKILLLLLFTQPVYAGDLNISIGGTGSIATFNQIGNSNLNFNAPNGLNNNYSVTQQGGNHNAQVQLNGNFSNYQFSLTQNSLSDLSISITQTCPTTCTPGAYSFTQY